MFPPKHKFSSNLYVYSAAYFEQFHLSPTLFWPWARHRRGRLANRNESQTFPGKCDFSSWVKKRVDGKVLAVENGRLSATKSLPMTNFSKSLNVGPREINFRKNPLLVQITKSFSRIECGVQFAFFILLCDFANLRVKNYKLIVWDALESSHTI